MRRRTTAAIAATILIPLLGFAAWLLAGADAARETEGAAPPAVAVAPSGAPAPGAAELEPADVIAGGDEGEADGDGQGEAEAEHEVSNEDASPPAPPPAATATLTVRVVHDGAPVPGVIVTVTRYTLDGRLASSRDRRTDESGRLRLEGARGKFVLELFPEVGFHGEGTATMEAEATDREVELAVRRSRTIRGRVIDPSGQIPLDDGTTGIQIYGKDQSWGTRLGAGGVFELSGYGDGPYRAEVKSWSEYFATFYVDVDLTVDSMTIVVPDEVRRELIDVEAKVFLVPQWSGSSDPDELDRRVSSLSSLERAPAGVRFDRGVTDENGILRFKAARGFSGLFRVKEGLNEVAFVDDVPFTDGDAVVVVAPHDEIYGRKWWMRRRE